MRMWGKVGKRDLVNTVLRDRKRREMERTSRLKKGDLANYLTDESIGN
jgi:hypothetical protein